MFSFEFIAVTFSFLFNCSNFVCISFSPHSHQDEIKFDHHFKNFIVVVNRSKIVGICFIRKYGFILASFFVISFECF